MQQMHDNFAQVNGLGFPSMGIPPNLLGIQPVAPAGLHALYAACRSVYPNQPNPLQVTAVTKLWMGGPDPLDFISMYDNPGDPSVGIPPHWHYISFGLSDLYGDGRLYKINGSGSPSGFGFELTFRLKKGEDESSPPTWPASVMQSLSKYVFNSDNTLCPGDHVSWHSSLDKSDSRIQHMLMTEDPQLGTVMTPFGSVTFVQIVGVCLEELQAAQEWNGPGLIDLMKNVEGAGGPWLVTDMRRGETIFELDDSVQESVDDGIAAEGSNLSGVTAKCSWSEKPFKESNSSVGMENQQREKIEVASSGHQDNEEERTALSPSGRNRMHSRASRHSAMSAQDAVTENNETRPAELLETKSLDSCHIRLNLEAGNILPLAFKGRLSHGRHFTFKTVAGNLAITLVTESVSGSNVTLESPYAIHGPWLQVLIPRNSLENMINEFKDVFPLSRVSLIYNSRLNLLRTVD
jgi:suppressor of fused-like protein